VHVEAEVHDTAFRKLDCAPDGLGEGTMRQAVPSHCSARVPAFEPPTAVHAEAEVHDTPFRKLDCAPEGLGEGTMRQAVPSHCSARVPAFEPPTAVHAEAEVQDTPDSAPPPAEGLGVCWICHAFPFHRSARVPAFDLPTAVHAKADVHATLLRTPPAEELGLAWMRHRVPSHRSAKGAGTPELLTAWPTPVHAEGDEQDTLNSVLRLTPRGLGIGCLAHSAPSQCSARVSITPEPWLKSPTAVQEDEVEQETPKS
jgi:hypothetical protein